MCWRSQDSVRRAGSVSESGQCHESLGGSECFVRSPVTGNHKSQAIKMRLTPILWFSISLCGAVVAGPTDLERSGEPDLNDPHNKLVPETTTVITGCGFGYTCGREESNYNAGDNVTPVEDNNITHTLNNDFVNSTKSLTSDNSLFYTSEEVINNILNSIEKYRETTNSSTKTNSNSPQSNNINGSILNNQSLNNTKQSCGDDKHLAILEELVNNIFNSLKRYQETTNTKTNSFTRNNQHLDNSKGTSNNNSNFEDYETNTSKVTTGTDSNIPTPANCTCVVYYRCNFTGVENGQDSYGFNEPKCESPLEVCCLDIIVVDEPATTVKDAENQTKGPADSPSETTFTKPQPIHGEGQCGRSVVTPTSNQEAVEDIASNGEFPWMVWVGNSSLSTLCGGSLIHPKVVLTAAHCVHGKDNLVIRVGEWDNQSPAKKDYLPKEEVKIKEILVHDNFNNGSLANDPALLILETPVTLSDHVNVVCLPEAQESMDGRQCIASGWGKQINLTEHEEGREVLKRVGPLPIVPREECQGSLRKTKLGEYFRLHETFICAGGIPGTDTCKGDGGSPLVCPSKTDSNVYVQAGIVAWGISCGTGTPGVYVNVPHFVPWIQEQLKLKDVTTGHELNTNMDV